MTANTMQVEPISVPKEREFKLDALQILSGATWFGLGTGAGMLLEYVTQGLLAARLGPTDFGVFNVGLQIFTFCLTLAVLALPSAVTYFIPNRRSEGESDQASQIVSTSLWFNLLAGLLVGGLLFLAATSIAEGLFREPRLVAVLRLLALAIPSSAVVALLAGTLRGLKMTRQASLLTTGYERALRLGFILLFLLAGLGLKSPALAYLPASILVLGWGLRYVYRSAAKLRLVRPTLGVMRETLGYALPLVVSQLLLNMKTAAQPLLLAFFLDTRATGIFAVAFLISGSFSMVLVAVNFLYVPVVSGISIDDGLPRIQRLYRMVTTWAVVIVYPVGLLLMLIPEAFLGIFGSQYVEGAWALRFLVVGALINVGTGTVGTTLLATGQTRIYLKINIIGVSISTGLSLLLVSNLGLVGAAIAQMLTAALWNGLSLLVVYRMYGMQPFSRHYAYVFVVGLACLLALYPGIRFAVDLSAWAVIGVVPVYAGLTLLILLKLRLLDTDTQVIVGELLSVLRRRLPYADAILQGNRKGDG